MEKINWNDWLGLRSVLTDEAVSLSLGLDHDLDWWRDRQVEIAVEVGMGNDLKNIPDGELVHSFFKRLRQLERHLEHSDLGESVREVSLKKFAAWSLNIAGWEIPQELAALINVQEASPGAELEAKPSIRKANNDSRLIGALVEIIVDKSHIYKSAEQLKIYLDAEYSDREGFKKRTLEKKFAAAKIALKDMKFE